MFPDLSISKDPDDMKSILFDVNNFLFHFKFPEVSNFEIFVSRSEAILLPIE